MAFRSFLSQNKSLLSASSSPVSGFANFSSLYLVKVGIAEFLNGIGKGAEAHVGLLESEIGDFQNKSLLSASSSPVSGFANFSTKSSLYLVKVGIPEFGIGKGVEAHVGLLESEIGDFQNKSLLSASSSPVSGFAYFSSKSSLYLVKVGIPVLLNGIGKGVEAHVGLLESEIGDFQKLLVTRSMRLRRIVPKIPCKHSIIYSAVDFPTAPNTLRSYSSYSYKPRVNIPTFLATLSENLPQCSVCDKKFQTPYLLEIHWNRESRKSKELRKLLLKNNSSKPLKNDHSGHSEICPFCCDKAKFGKDIEEHQKSCPISNLSNEYRGILKQMDSEHRVWRGRKVYRDDEKEEEEHGEWLQEVYIPARRKGLVRKAPKSRKPGAKFLSSPFCTGGRGGDGPSYSTVSTSVVEPYNSVLSTHSLEHTDDLSDPYAETSKTIDLYVHVGWPLYRKYGHAFEAFKLIVNDPDSVLNSLTREVKETGPDGQEVIKVVPALSEEVKDSLVKNIRRRMTPQPLKIRADIEMKCFQFDGVLHIKEAMRKAEAAGNKDCPVKIKLVAPLAYVLNTQTLDKEQGIAILNKAIEACTEEIERHKGKLLVKEAARAVSEREDKLLAEHMAKLGRENEEISGDEDSEEEEDTGMGGH